MENLSVRKGAIMQDSGIDLPARASAAAVRALWAQLRDLGAAGDAASANSPVLCNGAGLRHISAALLQVLLMADARLAAQGGLRVVGLGPEAAEALSDLGAAHLAHGGAVQ